MTQLLALIASIFVFLGQMNSASNIQTIVERQAKAWENSNPSAIAEDFTSNAIFIASGITYQGKEAIKQAAEDYFQQFTATKVTIKRIIIDNYQGAVEWDWSDRNKTTGKRSQAEDAIIIELQNDGKIRYWREYIENKK